MTTSTEDLQSWVSRLSEEEMPAMSGTARAIAEIAEDSDRHVSQLADIIHQDAVMTMHVLRLTNGAYHIPRSKRYNTVSRAIVMLGFDEVRSLCLTISVVGNLLKGTPRDELVREMARSFHAAIQARSLAVQRGDRASEEVFTAALLFKVGEMAFWCFGGEAADLLEKAMKENPSKPSGELQKQILGFELSELTRELAKKWGVADLLENTMSNSPADAARWQGVNLSHRFVRAVERGWDSAEVKEITKELSVFAGISPDVLTPLLKENAHQAIEAAMGFGAVAASQEIPLPPADIVSEGESRMPQVEVAPPKIEFYEPDPMFQLKVLREIGVLLEAGTDVNEVIEMVLEGLHRGTGMDRALFALLTPNRKQLRGKNCLGDWDNQLLGRFKFEMGPQQYHILQNVIDGQIPRWVAERTSAELAELIPDYIEQIIGKEPFFVAPTIVHGKPIGLFFADRALSGRPLTQNEYESFKQFVMQANLALEHIGKEKPTTTI